MEAEHIEISPLMREFSSYISDAIRKPLPPEVSERAKIHLVDTFAAIISGTRLVPGKKVIPYVKAQGGKPEAGVFGTRIVTSAPLAALANGMLAHADETDDTHPGSRTHPGSGVLAAVFAIGERDQLSGTAILRSMVLGYDIGIRMMLAITHKYFVPTGHHCSTFARVFGAAATACALLRLNAHQVRIAMSYAAQQAAGMSACIREAEHVQKAYISGMASHNGVAAALMVKHGFSGVEDIFSGDRNFFFTFAPNANISELTRGLGRDYEVLRCAIKRWPAGGPNQGAINVLHELMQQHSFKASDMEKIVARIPDVELRTVDNRDMPDICIQHMLAVMLVDGTLTFKSAHDFARMKDPKVLAMRKRVEAAGDPGLTDAQRRWRCVMEITLKDGRTLKHQTMAAKGSYENPLPRQEEEDKALDLLAPVLGKARARSLTAALWEIEGIKNVRPLRKLYSA